MKKYQWAIIGPGAIAHAFVKDLMLSGRGIVKAVVGRSIEKAQIFSDQYAIEKSYASVLPMLRDGGVDAVYVASPHALHLEHAKLCLEAGIPVLCEKPLTMNSQQSMLLVDSARKNKVLLMEALWSRFLPAISYVVDFVKSGQLGDIYHIHADFGFKPPFNPNSRLFDPKLGGGSVLDIGIYPIFLSYVLKGLPSSVRARKISAPTGVDAAASIILEYGNTCLSSLNCSFKSVFKCEAEIHGSLGKIQILGRWHETQAILIELDSKEKQHLSFARKFHGFLYEIEEFHKLLDSKKLESTIWNLTDSVNVAKIMDQVMQQAK